MEYYPIKLCSVPKEIIWGGAKLKKLYGKKAPFERIAESWELTARRDAHSKILNGTYASMTLTELLLCFPKALGSDYRGDKFPLLVKFIDARDDLSIQVHPDDVCAEELGGEGKTEMWYIVDADCDGSIIYGLKDGCSRPHFESALHRGEVFDELNRIPVKKGEVYFIPAGQIHAICHGILIAEIQQNSDTTYRVYDYDRVGNDGNKRELHITEALKAIKLYTDEEIKNLRFSSRKERRTPVFGASILCDCIFFRVSLIKATASSPVLFNVDEKSFLHLLFTDAYDCYVSCGGCNINVSSGESVFIPAGAGEAVISGTATVLLSEV